MTNIYDLQQRADVLRKKTATDSISPEEVGGLHADTLAYIANMERYASSLGIKKVYTSVSEMNGDESPVSSTGMPLKAGQLVTIFNAEAPDAENSGEIYAFQNPGWLLAGRLDSGNYSRLSNIVRGETGYISDNIRSPYTFIGNFATWAEVQTELDRLHNSDGGADNKVIGEFRVQLDGRNLLVRNWVQNWATGVFTQTVEGSVRWNGETMEQSLQIATYERRYNEGSGWSEWKSVETSGGNMILDWKTDAATTRKQVPQDERKAGMTISYRNASGEWINEQYVGTSFDDTSWAADANWQQIGASAIELAQELGNSNDKILSQKVVTDEILKNRVEIPNDLKKYNGWMDANGNYTTLVPSSFSLIPINAGDNIIITASDSYPLNFAFLKNALTPISDSEKFPLCLNQSRVTIQASETTEALIAPDDAKFLYVSNVYQGSKRFPKKIQINGVEYTPYITPSTLYNINIANDSYTTKYNSLVEAISTIPISMRSVGMIITFFGDNDSWNTYQFKGSEVEDSAFLLENNWLSYISTSSENNSYVSKKINVVCEKGAVTSTGLIYSKLIEELMTTPVFISFNAKYNQVFNVTCGDDWELRLFQYDTEKEFIIASDFSQNNAKININPNTRFVKFNLRKKDLSNVPTAHTITINVNAGDDDKIFSYNTNKGSYPLSKDGMINIQSYLRISSPNANDSNSTDVQDNDDTIYTDYGILMLPKSYNADGNATPLIVFCHGYSVHYTYNSTIIASSSYLKIDYLLSEGYAVMDMDGNPMSSDYGHCGSPMAIQSYLRGIKWVQDRFNVGKKIYLAGHSMGGLMAHCLCNLGVLDINACCLFSPATSMLMLMELVPNAKDSIANYYGLTGKRPTWSQAKGDLSDEEKTFVFSDENFLKWSYSSLLWAKNCDIDYATISNFANKYISEPTEDEVAYYSGKHKLTSVPIKFFQAEADKSCYLGWSNLIVKEYINAGENVEYRTFENAVHDGVNSVTNCGANTVVTLNGDEYTDIPTPQLEMVLFFKKYQ